MAALAGLILALATALASWQAHQIAKPLEALTSSAQRLGDGDFTVRTERSGITEADAAGLALEATARRLGRLLERERAFAANVSHQLRTPLTAMRLALESALERPDMDLREAAGRAIRRSDELERTIDDLLVLSREAPAQLANISSIIDDIRQRWHGPFAAAGRRLTPTVERDLPAARANPSAVRQILDVLLDNALRHGAGLSHVTAASTGDGVAIQVGDDGPGINGDPEAVFSRRVDDAGHGIGLALARDLAEASGARLVLTRAAPRPVFTLLLPPVQGAS
jgi:signal transduction histidine kinase